MQMCDFNCSLSRQDVNVSEIILLNLSTALIPARYVLSVLGSIAMAIIYGLKVNLSVAMVAMVNHTAVRLQNPHANDDHGSSLSSFNGTVSLSEECEAESRASSGVSQVNFSMKYCRRQFET